MYKCLISFCLLLNTVFLFSGEIFVSNTFLNYAEPKFIVIHLANGEVIKYEEVRSEDYANGLIIEFDNLNNNEPEILLTSISINYYRDGRQYFSNTTICGVWDGYILEYQKPQLTFQGNYPHPNGPGMYNHPNFDEVKSLFDGSMESYQITFSEAPILFEASVLTKLSDIPIELAKRVNDTSVKAFFPSELDALEYNFKTSIYQKDKNRFIDYYQTYTEIPNEINIPEEQCYISFNDDSITNISNSDFYNFFRIVTHYYDGENIGSYWFVYGSIDQEIEFKLPDFPRSILGRYSILELNYEVRHRVSYMINSKKDHNMIDLFSPFQIEDVKWLIENEALVLSIHKL